MENELSGPELSDPELREKKERELRELRELREKKRVVGTMLAIVATICILLLHDNPAEIQKEKGPSIVLSLIYPITIPLALLPIFYKSVPYLEDMGKTSNTSSTICGIIYIGTIVLFGFVKLLAIDDVPFSIGFRYLNHIFMVGTLGGFSYWLTLCNSDTQ